MLSIEPDQSARLAAEHAARDSYGRLLAMLVSRTGDIAGAEDALGDALLSAVSTWPARGVPESPDAWLLTAARRRLIDARRRTSADRRARRRLAPPREHPAPPMPEPQTTAVPDERLKLMFLCAHPAIDPAARTPLMLQCVLGLDAGAIASAFVVQPATMAQRLVRAKQKIRDAGMSMDPPPDAELAERVEAVLGAVYAAYTAGFDAPAPAAPDEAPRDLAREAIWLGRVLVRLMPEHPEPAGLLALMLYADSRRAARRDAQGMLVPLADQDPAHWDHAMIDEAESLLRDALAHAVPGRFQIEAAIQSVHAARRVSGATDWPALAGLYATLNAIAPSLGAAVAGALAAAEVRGAGDALTQLERIEPERVVDYQPYWAARASLLARVGRTAEARTALVAAIGLTSDPGVRAFLLTRLAELDARPDMDASGGGRAASSRQRGRGG